MPRYHLSHAGNTGRLDTRPEVIFVLRLLTGGQARQALELYKELVNAGGVVFNSNNLVDFNSCVDDFKKLGVDLTIVDEIPDKPRGSDNIVKQLIANAKDALDAGEYALAIKIIECVKTA